MLKIVFHIQSSSFLRLYLYLSPPFDNFAGCFPLALDDFPLNNVVEFAILDGFLEVAHTFYSDFMQELFSVLHNLTSDQDLSLFAEFIVIFSLNQVGE